MLPRTRDRHWTRGRHRTRDRHWYWHSTRDRPVPTLDHRHPPGPLPLSRRRDDIFLRFPFRLRFRFRPRFRTDLVLRPRHRPSTLLPRKHRSYVTGLGRHRLGMPGFGRHRPGTLGLGRHRPNRLLPMWGRSDRLPRHRHRTRDRPTPALHPRHPPGPLRLSRCRDDTPRGGRPRPGTLLPRRHGPNTLVMNALVLAEQERERPGLLGVQAQHHTRAPPRVVDRMGHVAGHGLGRLAAQSSCAPPSRPCTLQLARRALAARHHLRITHGKNPLGQPDPYLCPPGTMPRPAVFPEPAGLRIPDGLRTPDSGCGDH